VFFVLTGLFPLSLDDGEGHKPHQTTGGRAKLSAVPDLDQAQLHRLLSVFDRAFALAVQNRYATVDELLTALRRVVEPTPTPSDLLSMLDEVRSRWSAAGGETRQLTRDALHRGLGIVKSAILDIETRTGATATRGENHVGEKEGVPYMEARVGLSHDGGAPRLRDFRFEARGAGEYVLLIDNEDVWRGTDVQDRKVVELVMAALMTPLLDS
jgi:hypothetical protein